MATETKTPKHSGPRSRIWVWVVVAFAVQIALWTSWLMFASHHRVQEIQLETGPRRGVAD